MKDDTAMIETKKDYIDLKDERVLREMFRKYFPRLRALATRLLRDEMLASDMVQEAFLYGWQKAPRLEGEAACKSYLYYCVRNKCLNYLRDHRQELAAEELQETLEDDFRVDHWIIENEVKARILEEIHRLPEVHRNIMLLRLEGNSFDEISRALHLNINTLKTYKKQIYRDLRVRLTDLGEFVVAFVLGGLLY